jgi:hypothetical protein
VSPNTSVTIQTYNMPSYVKIQVRLGYVPGNEWVQMTDIDTGAGGNLSVDIPIPAQFANKTPLTIRLTQEKKNGKSFWQDQTFNNVTGGSGTGGWPGTGPVYCPGCYYGWGIPTIWIVGVQRDNSVTIQTHNFPANTNFDVLMGPMGTRAIGGFYVTSFNSGGGGSFQMTFSIPPQLYGLPQIAIRTQSPGTGFFSYNWFFNNTTY